MRAANIAHALVRMHFPARTHAHGVECGILQARPAGGIEVAAAPKVDDLHRAPAPLAAAAGRRRDHERVGRLHVAVHDASLLHAALYLIEC